MKLKNDLIFENKDPFVNFLNRVVTLCVKALAVLMVLVIVWSTIDVVYHLYAHSREPSSAIFNIDRLLLDLGAFLAVMIAIEVFLNIIFYLSSDKVHVPLVLATALTAVSRKVIIFDYSTISPELMYAVAAVIASIGVVFWLVTKEST